MERALPATFDRFDARRIDDLAYLAGVAFGVVLLLAFGYFDLLSLSAIQQGDFVKFWAGPRALLMGADPYDQSTWRDTAISLGALRVDWSVYGYFGWAIILMLPFALLPLEAAAAVWTIGGVALAVLAMRALLRTYLPGVPLAHTLIAMTLLVSEPARLCLVFGQWSFLLIASLAAMILWARSGREVPAALASVVLLAKPQLFLLTGFAVAAWARRSGHRIFIAGAVIASSLLVLASVVVLPSWPYVWIHVMPLQSMYDPPRTTTPAALLAEIFGPLGTWVALAAIVIGAVIAFRFDPRSDQWLALWSCLSLAAAPYMWSYDQLLLLVPTVIGAGVIAQRSRRVAILLVVGVSLILLLVATVLGVAAALRSRETYSAVIPMIVFALLAVALWWSRSDARVPAPRS